VVKIEQTTNNGVNTLEKIKIIKCDRANSYELDVIVELNGKKYHGVLEHDELEHGKDWYSVERNKDVHKNKYFVVSLQDCDIVEVYIREVKQCK